MHKYVYIYIHIYIMYIYIICDERRESLQQIADVYFQECSTSIAISAACFNVEIELRSILQSLCLS